MIYSTGEGLRGRYMVDSILRSTVTLRDLISGLVDVDEIVRLV
jgi:hypothetical protein